MMTRLTKFWAFHHFSGLLLMILNWSQFSNSAKSAKSHKFVQTGFMTVLSLLIYALPKPL